ncbi:MAG: GMC family oxidoreductase N-terminal domain-containing protein [Pseudomonadota bacterium]
MSSAEYDYIIVGSGSAGSVVANRLSADPDIRVLVLESGNHDKNFWLKLPVGYFRSIYDPRFSRTFQTEPSQGDGQRGIAWPRGHVIGGSSSINGLVFIRGQHADFDDWANAGATNWSYDQVLPYFKELERCGSGDDYYRGRHGGMSVSNLRNRNPACAAWLDAAGEYGLPFNHDFNGKSTYGVGAYQLSIAKRFRHSAASAFLKPVYHRPNLDVITNAHVSRVSVVNRRATGVEWISNGQLHRANVRREVVLSAGALQSPQILQLSGIGPAALLKSCGIEVIVDSPQVGANLQDHYQMRMVVKLKDKISLNDDIRNPFKLAAMGLQWLFAGSGPLTVGAGQVG